MCLTDDRPPVLGPACPCGGLNRVHQTAEGEHLYVVVCHGICRKWTDVNQETAMRVDPQATSLFEYEKAGDV